jgi:hypothetical protein
MGIIDVVLARFDEFVSNREIFWGRLAPPPAKVTVLTQAKRPRPVASFGADPSGFGEDWATYRTSKPQGPGASPVESELKIVDVGDDVDRWKGPDTSIPSLTSHGRALGYSGTDQRPPIGHDVSPADKPITINGGFGPRKSLETSARTRDKTIGDQHALDLKRYPYDFS